ncbi:MAG TPA: hypothetical protein VK338_01345 [Candidatus Nitrosocosmicus sp.]|nr:hypothetical protein [Candidatus Nitrosocosmicus sp.]
MNKFEETSSPILQAKKKKIKVDPTVINHRRLTDIHKTAREDNFVNNPFLREDDRQSAPTYR